MSSYENRIKTLTKCTHLLSDEEEECFNKVTGFSDINDSLNYLLYSKHLISLEDEKMIEKVSDRFIYNNIDINEYGDDEEGEWSYDEEDDDEN